MQSIVAAEVGYHEVALDYFYQGLYVDLHNLHGNTVDGLHVASMGGVWSALVFGFGGMRDHRGALTFDPRLPSLWPELRFRFCWRGSRVAVRLTRSEMSFTIIDGTDPVSFTVRGESFVVTPDAPVVVDLPDQGPRIDGLIGDHPVVGGTRADGSTITAGVPDPIQPHEDLDHTGEIPVYAGEPPHDGAARLVTAVSPNFTWRPANEATTEDVEAVFDTGGARKCRCQALKCAGWIWRDTTQEQRDAALLEQTGCGTDGPTSGLIGYLDGEPVGWVAVEPRGKTTPGSGAGRSRGCGRILSWSASGRSPASSYARASDSEG